jgi:hypothetical protein
MSIETLKPSARYHAARLADDGGPYHSDFRIGCLVAECQMNAIALEVIAEMMPDGEARKNISAVAHNLRTAEARSKVYADVSVDRMAEDEEAE